MSSDLARYPIGPFTAIPEITPSHRQAAIEAIAALPETVRAAVRGLNDTQLETTYRDGGWTLRQVVHHVADSHMNAYIRYKLALTEEVPTIKPYIEARWAEVTEARTAPVDISLTLLDGLHGRWIALLRNMKDADFDRTFFHPEHKREISLDEITQLYGWHGRHHAAQISSCRERMGWR